MEELLRELRIAPAGITIALQMRPQSRDDRRATARGRQVAAGAITLVLLLIAVMIWSATRGPDMEATARSYAAAWQRGDYAAMHGLTSRSAGEPAESTDAFASAHQAAAETATAKNWKIGEPREAGDGDWELPVTVRTSVFGLVKGTVPLRIVDEDGKAVVVWRPSTVFPGLRPGEPLTRQTRMPERATLQARDGTVLATGTARTGEAGPSAADIVGAVGPIPEEDAARARTLGYPDDAQVGVSGLERILDQQLAGTPGGELLAGRRVLARSEPKQAGAVRSSIDKTVQEAAVSALAGRLGGVTVLDPRSGEVLGVAGIAFSGLQPPGSTFKIVTVAGALEAGTVKMTDRFPVETAATLEGVRLENSFGEACGGSLVVSFAKSCNSVFAPIGAKLGAERLVKTAEAFGFNQPTGIAGAVSGSIPPASELGDDLGVGSTAIGQGRVQATSLTMSLVSAAVANDGLRPAPTLLAAPRRARPKTTRATNVATAKRVRRLMVAVTKPGGTGTQAAIEGVPVAGKTGTAELRDACEPDPANPEACPVDGDPQNTTAWFTAFAPAGTKTPRAVVTVMLVGSGHGGDTAAPAAKPVLVAALKATANR